MPSALSSTRASQHSTMTGCIQSCNLDGDCLQPSCSNVVFNLQCVYMYLSLVLGDSEIRHSSSTLSMEGVLVRLDKFLQKSPMNTSGLIYKLYSPHWPCCHEICWILTGSTNSVGKLVEVGGNLGCAEQCRSRLTGLLG